MPGESQLIQPLFSSEAFSTLTTVVPGLSQDAIDCSELTHALPSPAIDASRYRQTILTSVPLALGDFLALSACFLAPAILSNWILGSQSYSFVPKNLLALCLCHLVIGGFLGLFPGSGINPVRELRNQLTSIASSFLMLIALNGLLGQVTDDEVLTIAFSLPLAVLVAPVARFSMRHICAPFKWWGERVIVVGSNQHGRMVCEYLKGHPQRGLKLLGIVDDRYSDYWGNEFDALPFLGTVDKLVSVCRSNHCHWVIAAVADKTDEEGRRILTQGCLIPNLIVLNSRLVMPTIWSEASDVAGLSGIHIRDHLLFPFQRFSKRIIDIVLSACLILLFSPLLLVIGALVWLKSPGPVLYRHNGRIGREGHTFGVLKIRTMVQNADEALKKHLAENPEANAEWERDLKLKNDPRIIPGIGGFLRRTSLDELPQLWNVFIGEMSLVGPRPIVTAEIKKYIEIYSLYRRVRPGMTGLWQVSGRNNTSYADRIRLDMYYTRNWSLWLDYFILLRTVRTVLFREGSY